MHEQQVALDNFDRDLLLITAYWEHLKRGFYDLDTFALVDKALLWACHPAARAFLFAAVRGRESNAA